MTRRVIHKKCGGTVGHVPDGVLPGSVMRAADFTHIDGHKPMMGTKLAEKCPKCNEWIYSGSQWTIK